MRICSIYTTVFLFLFDQDNKMELQPTISVLFVMGQDFHSSSKAKKIEIFSGEVLSETPKSRNVGS